MPFETDFSEQQTYKVGFALALSDGYTKSGVLLGDVKVTTASLMGVRNSRTGTFVFPDLPPGLHSFEIRSGAWTPYYRPVNIPVVLPLSSALWPSYPDLLLADRDLPLDDPAQPIAYLDQLSHRTLHPSVAYPFASGATLLRRTVIAGGDPVSGATVSLLGGTEVPYVTGLDGQFVIYFPLISGRQEDINVRASHPVFGDQDASATLMRGSTVSLRINM